MSKAEAMAAALNQFLDVSWEVEAAAVVSGDGLPMASALPPEVDEDRLAAMSASLLTLGERAADGLSKGNLAQVLVEGDRGYVVLMAAGNDTVLVAVTTNEVKIGLMLYEMRKAAADVAAIMNGTTPAPVSEIPEQQSDASQDSLSQLPEPPWPAASGPEAGVEVAQDEPAKWLPADDEKPSSQDEPAEWLPADDEKPSSQDEPAEWLRGDDDKPSSQNEWSSFSTESSDDVGSQELRADGGEEPAAPTGWAGTTESGDDAKPAEQGWASSEVPGFRTSETSWASPRDESSTPEWSPESRADDEQGAESASDEQESPSVEAEGPAREPSAPPAPPKPRWSDEEQDEPTTTETSAPSWS
jgi:uncharacterized protein